MSRFPRRFLGSGSIGYKLDARFLVVVDGFLDLGGKLLPRSVCSADSELLK